MKKNELIKKIKDIKKSEVFKIVKERINEFKELNKKSNKDWFKELCFCILTANYTAQGGIKIQKEIDDGFLYLDQKNLEKELQRLGHRFYRKRAEYIFMARKYQQIKDILSNFKNEFEMREFLVKNIKGIGYKEASHFLRNVGFDNVAIIDRHILKVLKEYEYLEDIPKNLNRKKYMEIEEILRNIAKETKLTLSELDLILWYIKTGKILK